MWIRYKIKDGKATPNKSFLVKEERFQFFELKTPKVKNKLLKTGSLENLIAALLPAKAKAFVVFKKAQW